MKQAFERYTKSNTPYFGFDGHECYARVVDIYDGDTITVVFEYKGDFHKFRVRLANIDTCEMKSSNVQLKEKARRAKEVLTNLVRNGDHSEANLNERVFLVYLKCYKFDKYGRLLCDVYCENREINFSEFLLNEGLAYVYDGGKKRTEEEQLL
jgi:micrococcal nuclease